MFYAYTVTYFYFISMVQFLNSLKYYIPSLLSWRSVNVKTLIGVLFLWIAIKEMSYWDGHNGGTQAPWQWNAWILTRVYYMLIVFSELNKC